MSVAWYAYARLMSLPLLLLLQLRLSHRNDADIIQLYTCHCDTSQPIAPARVNQRGAGPVPGMRRNAVETSESRHIMPSVLLPGSKRCSGGPCGGQKTAGSCCSPWLVRPSGTHSATIGAIQISASVAHLRRICFSSTRCTERIRGSLR